MAYGFQVLVTELNSEGHKVYVWKDVHPTGGQSYRYASRAEAEKMARICYGGDPSLVRVVEVM